jgi:hypothetical protein
MDAAVAGAQQPGCNTTVSYSPFTEGTFTATITVSCTACSPDVGCVTCTTACVFTFTKL